MAFHKKRILMVLQQDSDSERNQRREEKLKQRDHTTDDNDSYMGDDESQDCKVVKKRIISKIINYDEKITASLKNSLSSTCQVLGDFSESSLNISICDYSKKNEDLVNLLDSHVNILNYVYEIMILVTKFEKGKDQCVPTSTKSEINSLFWELLNENCVNDMVIDIMNFHLELDPDHKIKNEIIRNNQEFTFSTSYIITMCKCLRHICAFEMLLNPLVI